MLTECSHKQLGVFFRSFDHLFDYDDVVFEVWDRHLLHDRNRGEARIRGTQLTEMANQLSSSTLTLKLNGKHPNSKPKGEITVEIQVDGIPTGDPPKQEKPASPTIPNVQQQSVVPVVPVVPVEPAQPTYSASVVANNSSGLDPVQSSATEPPRYDAGYLAQVPYAASAYLQYHSSYPQLQPQEFQPVYEPPPRSLAYSALQISLPPGISQAQLQPQPQFEPLPPPVPEKPQTEPPLLPPKPLPPQPREPQEFLPEVAVPEDENER